MSLPSYSSLTRSLQVMAQFNNTALIVADRDSGIVYSSGWLQVSTDSEYDHTKSGADKAGMTATFIFTGMPTRAIMMSSLYSIA